MRPGYENVCLQINENEQPGPETASKSPAGHNVLLQGDFH